MPVERARVPCVNPLGALGDVGLSAPAVDVDLSAAGRWLRGVNLGSGAGEVLARSRIGPTSASIWASAVPGNLALTAVGNQGLAS
jgi:hypothetical protein